MSRHGARARRRRQGRARGRRQRARLAAPLHFAAAARYAACAVGFERLCADPLNDWMQPFNSFYATMSTQNALDETARGIAALVAACS